MDLDDTLLTKNKIVTPYTLQFIEMVRNKNFKIVLNTARSYKAALPFINLVQPDYSILNGGAQILDKTHNMIFQKYISKELTNYVLELIKDDHTILNFSVEGIHNLYTPNKEYIEINPLAKYFSFKEEFMEPAYKILLAADDKEKWISLSKTLDLCYESYYDGAWFRLSKSTKYLGNVALFNLLNDTSPKDYVFGDDTGDMEMIQKAYHGVLLSNARESLQMEVLHITDFDNDHDGIARYMEKILEG